LVFFSTICITSEKDTTNTISKKINNFLQASPRTLPSSDGSRVRII